MACFAQTHSGFYERIRLYVTGPSHNGQVNKSRLVPTHFSMLQLQANFDITELEFFGNVAPQHPVAKK